MTALKPGATIGLIGGGQLARMMAMAAARLGYDTVVLEPQVECPAAQTSNRQIVAAYDDEQGLDQLADCCDVITYEFENIPALSLDRLAEKSIVHPQPEALEISQDRFLEKKFLNECGIETAPWHLVDDRLSLVAGLSAVGGKGILKTRRFGYDGKGQVRIEGTSEAEIEKALQDISHVPSLLEGFVAFVKEISVIAARNKEGQVVFYDCPENVHREGILRTSTVPASVEPDTIQTAQKATQAVLHALNYVGVIGMEFFVLADGSVLANEFAPRVHNSGHWTEAACLISQFEQHIRAVVGLPLASAERHSDCVMENLIGSDIERLDTLLQEPQSLIHLYGKSEMRQGRKMGHVTHLFKRVEKQ